MPTRPPSPRVGRRHGELRRDARGGSSSLLVAVVAPFLLLLVGLVVDGGGRLTAVQQAEGIAAQAARAGADAGASADIAGQPAATRARVAAETYLRDAGATGTVRIEAGRVTVTTTVTHRTSFLGLIGVHSLDGTGEATARLVAR